MPFLLASVRPIGKDRVLARDSRIFTTNFDGFWTFGNSAFDPNFFINSSYEMETFIERRSLLALNTLLAKYYKPSKHRPNFGGETLPVVESDY